MAARPRYAPEDPTLPKPWRALVDGNTGLIYFWNPQTSVTTYIKPFSYNPPPLPKPKENQDHQQQQQQDHNAGVKPISYNPPPVPKPKENQDQQQQQQQQQQDHIAGVKPITYNPPPVPKPKENQDQQQQQEDHSAGVKPISYNPPLVPKKENQDQQQQQDRNAGAGDEDSRGSRQGHASGFGNSKALEGSASGGYESSRMHVSAQSTMEAPQVDGKRDAGSQPAAEAYRRQREITVTEIESIYGQTPVGGIDLTAAQEPRYLSLSPRGGQEALSHVKKSGHAEVLDVSLKEDSKRVAVASCKVLLGEEVFNLVAANQMSKGDVLTVAKIAGINGAKQTSNLVPLCHNICLTHIRVDLTLNKEDSSVEIEGEAGTTGKTGVEMEAMTAVTVAGLTVYDMCKAASKDIRITDVHLEHKSGGKSGEWYRKQ